MKIFVLTEDKSDEFVYIPLVTELENDASFVGWFARDFLYTLHLTHKRIHHIATHTHTYTHSSKCTFTRIHSHINTRTQSYIHVRTHTYMIHTCNRKHIRT